MKTANSDGDRWANHSSFLFMTISAFLALNSPAWGQYSKYQSIENAIYTNQLHQGLITTIVETAPQQFEIQKETACENPLDSRIIVIYLDKTEEILTLEEALALIQQQDWAAAQDTALHTTSNNLLDKNHTFHKNYNRSVHSLGYVIIGGTVGYYLGKSKNLPPNPNVYTSPPKQYFLNRQNYPSNSRSTYNYQPPTANKTGTNSNKPKVTNNVSSNKVTAKSNSSSTNKTTTSSSHNKPKSSTQTHRSNHTSHDNSSDDDYSPANDDSDNDSYRHSVPDGRSGYFKSSNSSSSHSSSSHSG